MRFLCTVVTRPVGVWFTQGVQQCECCWSGFTATCPRCIQTMQTGHASRAGRALSTPLSQHVSKLHVLHYTSEPLQPCKDLGDCCIGFYRPTGAAGDRQINAELCWKTCNCRLIETCFMHWDWGQVM